MKFLPTDKIKRTE